MKHRVVKSQACGKFILLGEHFIVTSHSPALAFPIPDFHCEVSLSEAEKNEFYFESKFSAMDPSHSFRMTEGIQEKMEEALKAVLPLFKASDLCFKVNSQSNFPIQRGFGSSASFAVALSRALASFFDRESLVTVSVDHIESLFHKTPSGVDATTIFHEKPIRFEKGMGAKEIQNHACDFIIVDAGERRGSASLIDHVKNLREEDPSLWERLSLRMRDIVERVEYVLQDGNAEEVAYGVRQAQDILASLNLSTPKIDEIISTSIKEGVLAGKVSGAGGGGAVVLITHQGEGKEISERIKKRGVPVLTVLKGMDPRFQFSAGMTEKI